MHNEISDYLRMIDDADNAHSPTSRAAYADALIDVLRDIFTDEELIELAQAKAEGRLVKRGKWIYEHEWKCSSCGWEQSHDFNTVPNDILKYCPNCGAKMSKEAAEKALGGGEDAHTS